VTSGGRGHVDDNVDISLLADLGRSDLVLGLKQKVEAGPSKEVRPCVADLSINLPAPASFLNILDERSYSIRHQDDHLLTIHCKLAAAIANFTFESMWSRIPCMLHSAVHDVSAGYDNH
jgi:hypothetical protein